ncbi:MAG: CBS domain-containing protein [Sedimentisphaerales bacterium]|nr:CBS domain-containing protein [Sedimentisphaerales bacterium]
MKVSDVMNSSVHSISSSAMLSEAAQRMKKYDVDFLPVLEQNSIVSVLTDRDVVIWAVAEGKDPNMTPVKDIISPGIFSCSVNSDIRVAAQLMKNKQIRRLLVLSEDHTVVGVLSLDDLALKTNDEHLVYDVVNAICRPVKIETEI